VYYYHVMPIGHMKNVDNLSTGVVNKN